MKRSRESQSLPLLKELRLKKMRTELPELTQFLKELNMIKEKPITSSFEIDQFISDIWNVGTEHWTTNKMKKELMKRFKISSAQAMREIKTYLKWEDDHLK